MRFRCRIGLHDWSKWSEPFKMHPMSIWMWQKRDCMDCGLYDERLVK